MCQIIQRQCYQKGSPCQDAAGNWTTQRPPDHRKEMSTAVEWACFSFIRSGQNHLARHSERGKKTRQTEEQVGTQHQRMDRPGVRQVQEGSGQQRKMEETGYKVICGAPTTLAVKQLEKGKPKVKERWGQVDLQWNWQWILNNWQRLDHNKGTWTAHLLCPNVPRVISQQGWVQKHKVLPHGSDHLLVEFFILLIQKGLMQEHGDGVLSEGDPHSVWLHNLANIVISWGHISLGVLHVQHHWTPLK